MSSPTLKRALLFSLIGSVAIGAVLAIVFVFLNTWGWFEVRVLLTTGLIAVASLCVMACELSRTPKGMNVLPFLGFGLTVLASAMILVGMWSDLRADGFWKLSGALSAFAIATVHICLLSVAPLSWKYRWVYYIAFQLSYGLALIVSMMFFEAFHLSDSIARTLIALAIIDTALTLVIPILSRISRSEVSTEQFQTPLELRNETAIDHEIEQLRKRIAELEKLKAECATAKSS